MPSRNRGFTLVEVMIAVGILGVVTLGISTLLVNMNQQFAFANLKTDSINLTMQAESALRGSSSCLGNMSASSIVVGTAETLTNLKLYNSSGVVVSDLVPALNTSLPGGSKLQVSSMRLTAPSNDAAGPVLISSTATSQNFSADLVITVTHTVQAMALKPLRISGLQLQTDLAGVVTSCKIGTALICVTGAYNGSTSATNIAYADPGFSGTFATVFSTISTGGNWGLQCNPGWNMTGCRGSSLKISSSSTDASLTTLSNGCQSPNGSIAAGMNSTVFLTCCSSL